MRNSTGAERAALIKVASLNALKENQKVLELIRTMETASSCIATATKSLLASCKEVEGVINGDSQGPNAPEVLENIKSIYAAKLAICEIMEAGATLPGHCLPFSPTRPSVRTHRLKSYFSRGKVAEAVLGGNVPESGSQELIGCLAELESRPQWWTSYSNARQNAVVMCQSVRVEIERGKLLCSCLNMQVYLAHSSTRRDSGCA